MRLTDEMIKEDDQRYRSCNVLNELTWCGREVHHRKSITNDNIRFQAWLCRAAADLLKKQEPKQVIGIADSIDGMEVGHCPSCDKTIVNKKIDKTKFCKFCGQAVKWND